MQEQLYFYYTRHPETNAPIVTTCLLFAENGLVARGVAFVNTDMDNPCKKVGRQIAEGRARSALKHQGDKFMINFPANVRKVLPEDMQFKAKFMPNSINDIEEKIFKLANLRKQEEQNEATA
jgi:hypothetical protein